MSLRERWDFFCSQLDIPANILQEYWNVIETRYSENHRFYHTLTHLVDMFRHFDEINASLQCPALVAMAIFFHDVVYEPKRPDNEEVSAELFQKFADNFNDKTSDKYCKQTVVDWILATKKHETEAHRTLGIFGDEDLHYFLDIDMAILGVSENDYRTYADNIRKEYNHIPELLFRERRAKVLRNFLQVPNIYATAIFRSKFERKARENIEAEIERLEGKTE